MPNIIFAPKPMVDPYAGQLGETLNQLFSTIGQIKRLRQQRNQTNQILDIMKTPTLTEQERAYGLPGMTEMEKQNAIITVARNGGDVLRNMVARQFLSEALTTPYEKNLRQLKLESEKARAAYWGKGRTNENDMLEYSRHQTAYGKAQEGKIVFEKYFKGDKSSDEYKNSINRYDEIMNHHSMMMDKIREKQSKQFGLTTQPNQIPQTKVDAVTMAAPVQGGKSIVPQVTQNQMIGPPLPTDYNRFVPQGVQQNWSAMTPEQRIAAFSPTDQQNEFAQYIDKLDDESKQELQRIMASGNPNLINEALKRLRDKYGAVR